MPDEPVPPAPVRPGEAWNTLLVGDNLDVLPRLAPGSVDLVCTDPPYNTGNDFAYADRFRDAARDAPHADAHARRHSAWTAMMRPRLEAVRTVLAPHGAVFVSIDDNEAAHLRLLMDEVFGEANFLAQVVVNLNPKGRQLGRGFATSHEYVLAYARDVSRCVVDGSSSGAVDEADFPQTSADGRRFRYLPLRNTNTKFNPLTAPTLHYPLWGDPVSGRVATAAFAGARELTPVFGDGRPAVWRWSRPRVDERLDDLECRVIRGRGGERADIFQRDWLHREGGRRKKLRTIWLAEEIGSTDTAVAELKALVGKVFESPKPTGLVRRILETVPDDVLVLDPFAGSGTTGHAVALANLADGGSRRCISINSAEPTREGSDARLAGLATVADITRARLAAVADQLGGGLDVLP
ncbi:site-specific DNA-methyltransferase [Nocardioides sp. J2M5]|uniref:site-specific DNA-methyltransferase n=1 Tax=Nocardioides palaemonis TaxID=2829810 RepID=UPI001BA744BE|nr:site-specific DNA-methyltransferase [Nocardioides palaemonis]MBS2936629.1 site-specific DNA-methyltransferase [Nocardioides palaemonis]